MDELIYRYEQFMGMLEQIMVILSLISIAFGICSCFFGFKLFKFQVAVIGFVMGGSTGYILALLTSGEKGVALFGGLIMGILGAFIAYKCYLFSVFLSSFFLGTIGIGGVLGLVGMEPFTSLSVMGGLAVAVASLFLAKPVIIISTGMGGGFAVSDSLSLLLGMDFLFTLLGIALGVCGVIFQFRQEKIANGESVKDYGPAMGDFGAKAAAVGSGVKTAATNAYTSDTAVQMREKAKEVSSSAVNAVQSRVTGKQCPNCGKNLTGSSAFCGGCGTKVT